MNPNPTKTNKSLGWVDELTEILDGVYNHELKEVDAANRINAYCSAQQEQLRKEIEKLPTMQHGLASIDPTPYWVAKKELLELLDSRSKEDSHD